MLCRRNEALCHSRASKRAHMSEMDWNLEHLFRAGVVSTGLRRRAFRHLRKQGRWDKLRNLTNFLVVPVSLSWSLK